LQKTKAAPKGAAFCCDVSPDIHRNPAPTKTTGGRSCRAAADL
jgi:hypothetical protein